VGRSGCDASAGRRAGGGGGDGPTRLGAAVAAHEAASDERPLQFGCELDGGELRTSDESLEVAFVSPDEIDQWHTDHHERLTAALAKLC